MGGLSGAKSDADRFDDAFDVLQDVVVPEPQDTKAFAFQPLRTRRVIAGVIRMLSTVDFDDESLLETDEVDDEAADRRLAAEAMAIDLPHAKMAPEAALSRRRISPENTRDGCAHGLSISVMVFAWLPPTLTLPHKGGEDPGSS